MPFIGILHLALDPTGVCRFAAKPREVERLVVE